MNVIQSLIRIMETPIAKRKGISISADDCRYWAEALRKQLLELEEKNQSV